MADAPLVPLDKLDPAEAWQPWKPDAKTPWDLRSAGHLFRRATFGANIGELRQAVKDGPAATLDRLFAEDPKLPAREEFLAQMGEKIADTGDAEKLRGWWLYAMLHSLFPLREKLTLFWHDHFATSINKVNEAGHMYRQNQTLRKHALGKFGPMLLAIAQDPAMLIWLDSNANLKSRPNENFAREVMELFSLGVGNYTEKDIREAARAFTGWHEDDGKYSFTKSQHDDAPKTFLGKTGNFNGDDILRILLEQPTCARFLVRKLYRFYISEQYTPPDRFIEPLAESLRKSDYDIKALLRTMLSSRHFFSAYAYRQRIKSPVEFAVGAAWTLVERNFPQGALTAWLDAMGQTLFAPPNVKGWPGGTAWLNTSTVLIRSNFALALATGNLHFEGGRGDSALRVSAQIAEERSRFEEAARRREELARFEAEAAKARAEGKEPPPPPLQPQVAEPPIPRPAENLDIARLVRREKADTPEKIVQSLLELLAHGDVTAAGRAKVVAFLKKDNLKKDAFDVRIRETAHMIMTMPEFQLA